MPTISHDFNLAEISIISILELFNPTDLDKFYLIVPNSQFNEASAFFSQYLRFVTIINEDQLNINNRNMNGWQKQQVIKLNISQVVKTEFYIVLDSDCYLTKKISLSDIYMNNKPIVALIEKHRNNWLLKSCAYFNINYENECPKNVMNVTPQILKTSIVKETIQICNVEKLIANGCNEFWIYFCYILKKYKFEDVYHVDENKQLHFGGCWVKENMKSLNIEEFIKKQFADPNVILTLFQSNMYLDRNYYLPIIKDCIYKKSK